MYTNSHFPLLHFSTPNQTKTREIKIFYILRLFHPPIILCSLTFPPLQPYGPLVQDLFKIIWRETLFEEDDCDKLISI